jgi:hypothetical protein
MLTSSSQNKGIRVTYHTPPTKDLLKSQTMALIAIRGVNPRMGTTANAVTGTISKTVERRMYNMTTG